MQSLRKNLVLSCVAALVVTGSAWAQQASQVRSTSSKANGEAVRQTEKTKKQNKTQGDSIQIVSHINLDGATVASMRTAEQWSQPSLELTDTANRTVLTVDVADPAHPNVINQMQIPAGLEDASLELEVGTAALLTTSDKTVPPVESKSVSIVSFADPERPKTVQRFDNVTSIFTDRQRGLVYLASSDGLWILRPHSSADQIANQKQFEQMLTVQ
jgi:hypothetical protein